MGLNVFHSAYEAQVEKLVGLAAGCGYPKFAETPMKEADFWNGWPDENSFGYAMAKKNLIIQAKAYHEQYRFNSTILLPANLYGPNDNLELEDSHVVPAVVQKFVAAVRDRRDVVEIWGSGKASREFLYVDDLSRVILRSLSLPYTDAVNVGTGQETSIKELVSLVAELTGYAGSIAWNPSRPDGQLRRHYDLNRFFSLFPKFEFTNLINGLQNTVRWVEEVYQAKK